MCASRIGGGELVLHDLPRSASLVDRLEETGAEFLFGVPTHAIDLLAEMRANSLLAGSLQGISSIRGSAARQRLQKIA
jgi:acyl-CoA synthetase